MIWVILYFVIGYIFGLLLRAYQEKNGEPHIKQIPVLFVMALWLFIVVFATLDAINKFLIKKIKKFM